MSTRQLKDVYAVVERGGKREVKTILKGLDSPNGIAFSKGTLYVAERHRITRYDGIEDRLDNPPEAKVVIDNLDPDKQPGHFWKFLALGPDGKLYFNIGAPGNIVMPSYYQASIIAGRSRNLASSRTSPGRAQFGRLRLAPEDQAAVVHQPRARLAGRRLAERHAAPVAKRRASISAIPSATRATRSIRSYGKNRSCSEFTPPALKLGAHVAPIGMRFYTGKMFPAEYQNNIFIALRGSWNRTIKQGYNVTRVSFDDQGKPKMEPFLTGFLLDEKADPPMWGRPADVMVMRDGSLLVSDDHNGIIYRVSYGK